MTKHTHLGRRVLSLVLTLVLSVSLIQMSALAEELKKGSDVTGRLGGFQFEVTQDGKAVTDGATVDTGKALNVKSTFSLPLVDEKGDRNVQTGDYAVIPFPEWLTFETAADQPMYLTNGTKVGTVHFEGNNATVTFNMDAVDKDAASLENAWFAASMKCVGSGSHNEGSQDFTVLGSKYFTFQLEHTVRYALEKQGQVNKDGTAIDWTLTATAQYSDGNASLEGWTLTDDLTRALAVEPADTTKEKRVTDFKVNGKEAAFQMDGATLSYTFGKDAEGAAKVTFSTPFDKNDTKTTGSVSVVNAAQMTQGSKKVTSNEVTVKYEPTWISKTAVHCDKDGNTVGDSSYSPYYKWLVTVNAAGCTLENAQIRDVLPKALQFVSAKYTTDNQTYTSITPDADGVYSLGTISEPLTLIIDTKIADLYQDNPVRKISKSDLTNTAYFQWDHSQTFQDTAAPSGDYGFQPLTKSGAYHAQSHTATWTVNVNTKGLDYGSNLRVYDLIVNGKTFDAASAAAVTGTLATNAAAFLKRAGVHGNSAEQTFVDNSFKGPEGVTCSAVPLKDKAGNTATLLEISGVKDGTQVTFDTKMTNPDAYAGNNSGEVPENLRVFKNNAYLLSENDCINEAYAYVNTGYMLMKDILSQTTAQDLEKSLKDNTDFTQTLARAKADGDAAFDYQNHTAYFRIQVNADGLDFDKETGKPFTFTDTLPAGWSFDKIGGADFLLYEGKADELSASYLNLTNRVTDASTLVTTTSGSVTGQEGKQNTLSFQFTKLDHPYLIVVKAKMDQSTFDALYNGNNAAQTYANQVISTSEAYTAYQPKDYETVTLKKPEVLSKGMNRTAAGELNWTVDYHAYNITRGKADGKTTNAITDTLPAGVELRTDAAGNLIYDGNITLTRLTLQADGTYVTGEAVTGDALEKMVTYNLADRTLTLTLPDGGNESYRLTYLTDVTGKADLQINNTVSLNSSTQNASDVKAGYRIQETDAGAELRYGGKLQINKVGADGAQLTGAVFTLLNEKGLAVRTASTENGVAVLKAIPVGTYTLRETAAPKDYAPAADRTVTVQADRTVLVNGAAVNGSVTITDLLTDSTSLSVSKQVTGNAVTPADQTKTFSFTVTLSGKENASYVYTAVNGADGSLKFVSGKASLTLTSGQSVTLWNLPVNDTYTVTEGDYSKEGFTASVNGAAGVTASGKLEKGVTAQAAFTNTKSTTPVVPVPIRPGTNIPGDPTPGSNIPKTPATPATPVKPVKPVTPATDIPGTAIPTTGANGGKVPQSGKTAVTPKTGDALLLWAALAAASATGLGVLVLRRKRGENANL